ncbi:hypothetical protein LY78DRAFT_259237 [Colletotrichum sublineola]|nr:hypothetical protein LY78DRAFT_259237 [Colletotrichum sublineola]
MSVTHECQPSQTSRRKKSAKRDSSAAPIVDGDKTLGRLAVSAAQNGAKIRGLPPPSPARGVLLPRFVSDHTSRPVFSFPTICQFRFATARLLRTGTGECHKRRIEL